MEHDHMKKALQSRRGKGLDISIVLGPHDGGPHAGSPGNTEKEYEHDKKNTDLAPPPDHPLDVDHAAGVPSPHPADASPMGELHDSDLLGGMTEHDKADTSGRAPRSLGERARRDMILAATAKK